VQLEEMKNAGFSHRHADEVVRTADIIEDRVADRFLSVLVSLESRWNPDVFQIAF
jgi:hypothetical protein